MCILIELVKVFNCINLINNFGDLIEILFFILVFKLISYE